MEDLNVSNGTANINGDASVQLNGVVKENDNLNVDFLEDLDKYWDDINSRLTVSRMVNDSVIRGIVNAVEQEAAEKIIWKESEVASLKESLNLYHVAIDKKDLMHKEACVSFTDAFVDHLKIKESLGGLEVSAKNQLHMLSKEVKNIRKFLINSSFETSGLGGILQGEKLEGRTGLDRMVDSLKLVIDTAFRQMNDMVYFSKESLSQRQQEQEFREEIEWAVTADCVRSLEEEFEEKLWEKTAKTFGDESLNWLEKMKEISSLRQEVDLISKYFHIYETGHPTFHGTLKETNGDQNHWTDHLNSKLSGGHIPSLWEVNGKHDELGTKENFDVAQFKNMSIDEVVSHFKTEMSKMKRDHDKEVQELTEDYFSLRREYLNLKGRGSVSPVKRDKEFEVLRKKIPDVILKLDKFLSENDKLPTFGRKEFHLAALKDRLDSLVVENRQLRDSLAEKKKEINCLHSQANDASEKISQLCQAEEHLLKTGSILESAVEDSQIEALISQDVYACHLRALTSHIKYFLEESDLKCHMIEQIYDIVLTDLASNAALSSKKDLEDSHIESVIAQGLSVVVLTETLTEAEDKLRDLNMKYISETRIRASLETHLLEQEKSLNSCMEENKRLKQDIVLLRGLVEENEKQLLKSGSVLAKETERVDLAFQELNFLRTLTSQQKGEILKSSEESRFVKAKLDKSLEQIKVYEVEKHKLRQKLEEADQELKGTHDEKMRILSYAKEKQQKLSMVEAKDAEQRKQVASLFVPIDDLIRAFTSFECRVSESAQNSNTRLRSLQSQLGSLTEEVDILKQRGSIYKQRFERKCSDLQKAENEVDLLGDQVDTLLSLLEKMYIALDHYSPVLKHYPGIIEILKLVRRELSGEPRRLV